MTATVVSQGAELSAHDVVVYRGKRRILDDVSLTIAPGQLVAVVGPSGGGKSTLLESLAGMRPLAGGSVRLDDLDVHTDLDRVRSQVGFVPQDDIIHRELPLRSTLRHAARLRLATGVDHDEVVGAVLADLDLVDQASLPVGSLSGGQRKRASVAVELLARPRLLLLDEPTAGLDPTTAAALMRTLRRLADSGCTVVLTTHNTQDLYGRRRRRRDRERPHRALGRPRRQRSSTSGLRLSNCQSPRLHWSGQPIGPRHRTSSAAQALRWTSGEFSPGAMPSSSPATG